MTRKVLAIICDGCNVPISQDEKIIVKSTPWRDELHFCSQICVMAYAKRSTTRPQKKEDARC